jgi:hypothetical protein
VIIWLASYPRSGNSFTRIVLKHLFDLQSRTIYHHQLSSEVERMANIVGEPIERTMTLEEVTAAPDVWIVKTHEMPQGDDHPAIHVVRDGRDALVSYAHFILYTESRIEIGADRDAFLRILEQLVLSDAHFGGWSRNALAWQQRARTVSIRYEDLLVSPGDLIGAALASFGQSVRVKPSSSLPNFENLHDEFPWFFRKGKIGTWRTEMPEALHNLFWECHGEAMTKFGYRRDGAVTDTVLARGLSEHPSEDAMREAPRRRS